eukprot:TRINITY_DN6922_c0_g1_i4.p1 TRINITY_DN6922_c0_g1~~TRINITY_DN6922_c0_g1_i4.p1  ORF type:complete len:536 (+),score=107.51 TRINITY_DN6922_c0_g1_i4:197-1804(+)
MTDNSEVHVNALQQPSTSHMSKQEQSFSSEEPFTPIDSTRIERDLDGSISSKFEKVNKKKPKKEDQSLHSSMLLEHTNPRVEPPKTKSAQKISIQVDEEHTQTHQPRKASRPSGSQKASSRGVDRIVSELSEDKISPKKSTGVKSPSTKSVQINLEPFIHDTSESKSPSNDNFSRPRHVSVVEINLDSVRNSVEDDAILRRNKTEGFRAEDEALLQPRDEQDISSYQRKLNTEEDNPIPQMAFDIDRDTHQFSFDQDFELGVFQDALKYCYNSVRRAKSLVEEGQYRRAAENIHAIQFALTRFEGESNDIADESALSLLKLLIANIAKIFYALDLRYRALENAERILRIDSENFEAEGMVAKIFKRLGQHIDIQEFKHSLTPSKNDPKKLLNDLIHDCEFLARTLSQITSFRITPLSLGPEELQSLIKNQIPQPEPEPEADFKSNKKIEEPLEIKSKKSNKMRNFLIYAIPCGLLGGVITRYVYKVPVAKKDFWLLSAALGLFSDGLITTDSNFVKLGLGLCLTTLFGLYRTTRS